MCLFQRTEAGVATKVAVTDRGGEIESLPVRRVVSKPRNNKKGKPVNYCVETGRDPLRNDSTRCKRRVYAAIPCGTI